MRGRPVGPDDTSGAVGVLDRDATSVEHVAEDVGERLLRVRPRERVRHLPGALAEATALGVVGHEAAYGLPCDELFRPRAEGGSSAWKRWVALVGMAGAPIAGALGAGALLVGRLLGAGPGAAVSLAGTVLLCSVVPLLLLGATALDWLEDDLCAREREGDSTAAAPPRR